MSDVEEPPSKVSKCEDYEMSQTFTQNDELDEGQEEWLSEDLLTDDDGNTTDAECSDSALGTVSQDMSVTAEDSNIEETLNSLENQEQDGNNDNNLPDSLDEFLIRKTKSPVAEPNVEDSDGNDTDDLLRMLEDDGKTKKKTKKLEKKSPAPTASSDEDDDDKYEETNSSKSKMTRSVLMKKQPATKAVPEVTTETDASADEATTPATTASKAGVKRQGNYAAKSTSKPHMRQATVQVIKLPDSIVVTKNKAPVVTQHPTIPKDGPPVKLTYKPQTPKFTSPPKQPRSLAAAVGRKVATPSTAQKRADRTAKAAPKPPAKIEPRSLAAAVGRKVASPAQKGADRTAKSTPKPPAKIETRKATKRETEPELDEDTMDEDDFAEEDDIDLDEDFALSEDEVADRRHRKQPMMYPERLDEDMLSDLDSESDDSSLYGEFPSSGEDELDEWFALDLRDERAGDYIPMLGHQALDLLKDEKVRTSNRLNSLKQSLQTLAEDGKKQAEKLRVATATLAEIEDLLKVS